MLGSIPEGVKISERPHFEAQQETNIPFRFNNLEEAHQLNRNSLASLPPLIANTTDTVENTLSSEAKVNSDSLDKIIESRVLNPTLLISNSKKK